MFIQNTPNFISPNRQCFMAGFESQLVVNTAIDSQESEGDDFDAQIDRWQTEIKATAQHQVNFSVDLFKNPHLEQLITRLTGAWKRFEHAEVEGVVAFPGKGRTSKDIQYNKADVMALQLALKIIANHDPVKPEYDPTIVYKKGKPTTRKTLNNIDGKWGPSTETALRAYHTDHHISASGFTSLTFSKIASDLGNIQLLTKRHDQVGLDTESHLDTDDVDLTRLVVPSVSEPCDIDGDINLDEGDPRNEALLASAKDVYYQTSSAVQYTSDINNYLKEYDFNGIGKQDVKSREAFVGQFIRLCEEFQINPNKVKHVLDAALPSDKNVDFRAGERSSRYFEDLESGLEGFRDKMIAVAFNISAEDFAKTGTFDGKRRTELIDMYQEEVTFLNLLNNPDSDIADILHYLKFSEYEGVKILEKRERALVLLDAAKDNDVLRGKIQGLNHFQKLELYGLLMTRRDYDPDISDSEHADYCSVLGVYLSIHVPIEEFETYSYESKEVSINSRKVKEGEYSAPEQEVITTHLVERFAYYKDLLIQMGINEDAFNDIKGDGSYFVTGVIALDEIDFNSDPSKLKTLDFNQLYTVVVGMRDMVFSIDHDADAAESIYHHDESANTREVYLKQINEVSFLHKAFFDLLNSQLDPYDLPETLTIDFDANDPKLQDVNYWIDPEKGQADVEFLAGTLRSLFQIPAVQETLARDGMQIQVTTNKFSDGTSIQRFNEHGKPFLLYSLTSRQSIHTSTFEASSEEYNTQIDARKYVVKAKKRQKEIDAYMPVNTDYRFSHTEISDAAGMPIEARDGDRYLGTILDQSARSLLRVWVDEDNVDEMTIEGVKNTTIEKQVITWVDFKRKLGNKTPTGYVRGELERTSGNV